MTDVFAMQEEIARSVVGALKVRLSPQEEGALGTRPTQHVQAYDYYLRGRKFYYQFSRREMEFALQLFSRAVELDRRYALAHAGLADCWTFLYLYVERNQTLREQADAASRRAVELAPDSAQAHASRGAALSLAGRHDEAVHSFEAAIRLDPMLFEAWYFYARSAFVEGDLEKAANLYEHARRSKPDDYQSPLLVGQIYDDLGRHDDAKASRLQGVAIAEEWLHLHPEDTRALYMAANGLVALGDRERGLTWARKARAVAPDEPMVLYNVGCIEALAGNADEAVDALTRAVDHGLTQRGWFEHDSNLDSIRGDPRFVALLDRLA
jgi:tetratricopeptide (TPR) repeat protein